MKCAFGKRWILLGIALKPHVVNIPLGNLVALAPRLGSWYFHLNQFLRIQRNNRELSASNPWYF